MNKAQKSLPMSSQGRNCVLGAALYFLNFGSFGGIDGSLYLFMLILTHFFLSKLWNILPKKVRQTVWCQNVNKHFPFQFDEIFRSVFALLLSVEYFALKLASFS